MTRRPTDWPHKEEPQLPVTMRTDIDRDAIRYEVRVSFDGPGFEEGENENSVWYREVFFGSTDRHCAGGAAFIEAAREQQRIADEWRDAIIAEGR